MTIILGIKMHLLAIILITQMCSLLQDLVVTVSFCNTCLNSCLCYYKLKPRNVQYCLMNAYLHDLGIQQAPAIGRAIAELIYDDDFQTIDLTRFLFDRMLNDVKMMEAAIV